MTALSVARLRQRMADPPETRLVVAPMLDAEAQLKHDQAAIDVRLGRAFSMVRPWSHGVAERFWEPVGEEFSPPPLQRLNLDFGEPLIVHPHQFVLARTLEFVRVPADLVAYVIGRSSWGRRGLIVATAVVVHPGFAGPITLELKNVGEVPLAVYPLDRVAQLTFHAVEHAGTVGVGGSQFATAYSPDLGQVRDPATERRIRALARQRRADPSEADGTEGNGTA